MPLVDTFFFRELAPMLTSGTPPVKLDMAASLAKPLPDEVLNRPKTGFAVPMRDWLLKNDPPRPNVVSAAGPARLPKIVMPDPGTDLRKRL